MYGNWAKPQTQRAESCAFRTQELRNPQGEHKVYLQYLHKTPQPPISSVRLIY